MISNDILGEGPSSVGEDGPFPSPIISLDPGGTTGIAIAHLGPYTSEPHYVTGSRCQYEDVEDFHIKSAQISGDHHKELFDLLYAANPGIIVCEGFYFIQSKDKTVLDSKEYIGIVKMYAQQYKIKTKFQKPTDAKNFCTDEKLKKLGLYLTGKGHGNDAKRHLVHYMYFDLKIRHAFNQRWRPTS